PSLKELRLVNLPYGAIVTRCLEGAFDKDEVQRQLDSLPSKEPDEDQQPRSSLMLSLNPRHSSGRKIALSVVGAGETQTLTLECLDFRIVSFLFSDHSSYRSATKVLSKQLDYLKFQTERDRFASELWVTEKKRKTMKGALLSAGGGGTGQLKQPKNRE